MLHPDVKTCICHFLVHSWSLSRDPSYPWGCIIITFQLLPQNTRYGLVNVSGFTIHLTVPYCAYLWIRIFSVPSGNMRLHNGTKYLLSDRPLLNALYIMTFFFLHFWSSHPMEKSRIDLWICFCHHIESRTISKGSKRFIPVRSSQDQPQRSPRKMHDDSMAAVQ